MTKLAIPLILLIALVVGSCSRDASSSQAIVVNPFDSLKVGMTYDEVEKWLGKPKEINRGFTKVTEVEFEVRGAALEDLDLQLKLLDAATVAIREGRLRDIHTNPLTIETSGQLIYVSWAYDSVSIDSAYQIRPKYAIQKRSKRVALANGVEINPGEEWKVEDSLYLEKRDPPRILTRDEYYFMKRVLPNRVLPPVKAKIETTNVRLPDRTVWDGTYPHLWFVLKRFNAVFDASSGRLVQWAMLPVECRAQELAAFK